MSSGWIDPLLVARERYAASARVKPGTKPIFNPPHTDAGWEDDWSRPTKYATAMARLNQNASLRGFKEVERSISSPRDGPPTGDPQFGWEKEGRTYLGRRGPDSEMQNRYDRSRRNAELRARNDILQKCRYGWKPTSAPTLPRKRPNTPENGADSSSVDSTSI